MSYMGIKSVALKYFETFEKKDIDALEDMFHENVSLKDWNISANGKNDVLKANKEIFSNINKIAVTVKNIYVSIAQRTVIAELEILADDEPPLPVVDVITYDLESLKTYPKIESIIAYRGN